MKWDPSWKILEQLHLRNIPIRGKSPVPVISRRDYWMLLSLRAFTGKFIWQMKTRDLKTCPLSLFLNLLSLCVTKSISRPSYAKPTQTPADSLLKCHWLQKQDCKISGETCTMRVAQTEWCTRSGAAGVCRPDCDQPETTCSKYSELIHLGKKTR